MWNYGTVALAKVVRHCPRLLATSTGLRQLSAPHARDQARVFFVFFELSLPRSVRPREICYRSYDLRLNADVQLPRLFFLLLLLLLLLVTARLGTGLYFGYVVTPLSLCHFATTNLRLIVSPLYPLVPFHITE